MAFRPALTSLRSAWEEHFGSARPSDGFLLVAELRVTRIAASYPPKLQRGFRVAVAATAKALGQPIRYAGPGGETHGVFPPPRPASELPRAAAVPGTSPDEPSVLVRADLWAAFRELSLWVEMPPTTLFALKTIAVRSSCSLGLLPCRSGFVEGRSRHNAGSNHSASHHGSNPRTV